MCVVVQGDRPLGSIKLKKQVTVWVLGADTQQSRYIFCKLKLASAHQLVERFGKRARFSIIPICWYKWDDVDNKEHRYESYVSAEKRG